MKRHFSILLVILSMAFNSVAKEEHTGSPGAIRFQKKDGMECRYLSMIEDGFLKYHVNYNKRDKELEKRVIEQHIKKLDSSKIYFVQADIEKIHDLMKNLFDKTKKNDCDFLVKVQDLLVERVEERAAFAEKFLGKGYKFDSKTEFVYDPDKKSFPKNTEEANDFIKKYIHFQVANYMSTDMKQKEAQEKVVKNYELAVKRIKEGSLDDLYSSYLDSFARSLDPH
ncbi:MAG: hypothetical protein KDD45_18280, partial [Bdellovibrionales bacterium]|nr:hypothetical protein [Bdellovibrionales bacterium]